jgi:polyferredoxin
MDYMMRTNRMTASARACVRVLIAVALLGLFLVPLTVAQDEHHTAPDARGQDEHHDAAEPADRDHHDDQAAEGQAASAAASGGAQPSRPSPPGLMDFLGSPKYLTILGLMIAGLALLLGRFTRLWVRIAMMAIAFVLFGLDYVFPLHPSPMCASTKLFMFKFTMGRYFPAFLALFLIMMVPSLVGRKLFCGWVCPLGALQDLINKIPFKPRWKTFNFAAFNSIRMALLALFFLTFFGVRDLIAWLAGRAGADTGERIWAAASAYSVYEPVNFFELLHWQVSTTFFVMFAILIIASLMLYRPFCYSICPIGALTWLAERVAPGRVRIDKDACTECGDCELKSPCPTIFYIKEEKSVMPDCTSCGECVGVCPESALRFSFRKLGSS